MNTYILIEVASEDMEIVTRYYSDFLSAQKEMANRLSAEMDGKLDPDTILNCIQSQLDLKGFGCSMTEDSCFYMSSSWGKMVWRIIKLEEIK